MEDKLPGLVNVYSLRTWSHDRRKFVDLASYKMVIFHSFLYVCLSEGKYTLSFFWLWIKGMDRGYGSPVGLGYLSRRKIYVCWFMNLLTSSRYINRKAWWV